MLRIALSYRRSDSAGITGRIYDHLTAHFGEGSVFMDIDAIPLGVNFRRYIADVLKETDFLLPVIGAHWAGAALEGERRIDDATDLVRVEIASALRNESTIVIPLLIDGAPMPEPGALPEELRGLCFINAASISSGRDFSTHLMRIIGFIEDAGKISSGIGSKTKAQSPPRPPRVASPSSATSRSLLERLGLVAISLLFVGLVSGLAWGAMALRKDRQPSLTPPSARDLAAIASGLKGYWPLDESAGNVARDASPARDDGTIDGYVDRAVPGGLYSALKFDGRSSLVSIPKAVIDTSKSYSMAVAVFSFGFVKQERDTIASEAGYAVSPFYLEVNRYQFFTMRVMESAVRESGDGLAQDVRTPLTGAWYNVIGVYDAKAHEARIFVNGTCQDRQPAMSSFKAPGPLIIGAARYAGGDTDFFHGYIAQVRLYARILSDREARTLYWVTMHQLHQPMEPIAPTNCVATPPG